MYILEARTWYPFVQSNSSDLVDYICKRYPGKKPSDYLGVTDELTAFDLDAALATKGEIEDRKFLLKLFQQLNDNIAQGLQDNAMLIAKALGAKVRKKKRSPDRKVIEAQPKVHQTLPENVTDVEKLPSLEEALSALGGRGTVIQR